MQSKGFSFELMYYAENDLAINHDINNLITAYDQICEYFKFYEEPEEMNEDSFTDYLVAKKIVHIKERTPYNIDESIKEQIDDLLQVIAPLLSPINKGAVIRFLNTNYETLLSKEVELKIATASLMKEYINGISVDAFSYLIERESFFIFDNYESFKKKIEQNESLLELLFSVENLRNQHPSHMKNILRIVEAMNNRQDLSLKKIVDRVIEICISRGKVLFRELTADNSLSYSQEIGIIYDFLRRLKHPQANAFLEQKKRVDTLVDEHIETFGQEFRFELPITESLTVLLKNPDWPRTILSLTHIGSNSGRYTSRLASQLSTGSQLLDLVGTLFPTDSYFTFTNQEHLKYTLLSGGGLLHGCVAQEDSFLQLKGWYEKSLQEVVNVINPVEDNIEEDIEVLLEFLDGIHSAMKEGVLKNGLSTRALSYGAASFICAISEKLLRNFYFYISKEEIFIPLENITLGNLLNGNGGNYLEEIFGTYHLKHLRYFLSTDGEKRIGLELRNRLAHWRGLAWKQMDPLFVLQLLYLFTDILNTILLETLYRKKVEGDSIGEPKS